MRGLHISNKWIVSGALLAVLIAFAFGAQAQLPKQMSSTVTPREFKGVGIHEQLGQELNLQEKVMDEDGHAVTLSSFFKGRPVILSPVYFSCPSLCNFHLNGLIESLKSVDWTPGKNFDVIALSFDPKETSALAKEKKAKLMQVYNRPGSEGGWHFVTGDAATLKRITDQLGFSYHWDEEQKQWAHASAAVMLTPSGRIARYLHGIQFDPATMKMGLNEAGNGKVGTFVDTMVWFCFHYDPHQSKYTLYAFRLVQLGGILTILLLAGLMIPAWYRGRHP